MLGRMKFVGVGVLAMLLLGALTAGAALGAKKAKPELILKTADEGKKDGTTIATGKVPAGWYLSIGTRGFCQLIRNEETETEAEFRAKEGSQTLSANSSTKADVSSGDVAIPTCYEEEAEPPSVPAFVRRSHAAGRRGLADVAAAQLKEATGFTLTGGALKGQEMTVKHKGVMTLSAPLVLTVKGATTCKYEEKKTKIKATWPPRYATKEPEKKKEEEEFPLLEDTANLVAEVKFKAEKGNAKSCEKSEEIYIESWLGPLGEEYEADLT
jgi:hypothetical protein